MTLPYLEPVMPVYSGVLRKFLGAEEGAGKDFRLSGTLRLDLKLRQQLRITKVRAQDLD